MADYQLRLRLPQETADSLSQVIKDIQEVTEVADVTTSSITRAALENYIKDHNSNSIKIELDKARVSTKELKNVIDKMVKIVETFGTENIPRSPGEQYIYNMIIHKLMVEETDRWNKSNK